MKWFHQRFDAELTSSVHVEALEKELTYARQSLNATIEELQAANEEMHSTNEQLVPSNEELQSTNEELYTVNAEYQGKIAEQTDDMDNLLNSTHVDTIFLDRELKVRKFTPDVAEKYDQTTRNRRRYPRCV